MYVYIHSKGMTIPQDKMETKVMILYIAILCILVRSKIKVHYMIYEMIRVISTLL